MNERIQELAIMANPSSKEIYEADNWQYNCAAWDSNNLTKFAELIVAECKKAIDPTGDLTSMSEAGWRKACMKMIDEHFGVEE